MGYLETDRTVVLIKGGSVFTHPSPKLITFQGLQIFKHPRLYWAEDSLHKELQMLPTAREAFTELKCTQKVQGYKRI
jgi:hypothetical protein